MDLKAVEEIMSRFVRLGDQGLESGGLVRRDIALAEPIHQFR